MRIILAAVGISTAFLGIVFGAYIARVRAENAEVQRLAAAVCHVARVGQSVNPPLALGAKLGGVRSSEDGTLVISFTRPSSETMRCLIGQSSGIVEWAETQELGD